MQKRSKNYNIKGGKKVFKTFVVKATFKHARTDRLIKGGNPHNPNPGHDDSNKGNPRVHRPPTVPNSTFYFKILKVEHHFGTLFLPISRAPFSIDLSGGVFFPPNTSSHVATPYQNEKSQDGIPNPPFCLRQEIPTYPRPMTRNPALALNPTSQINLNRRKGLYLFGTPRPQFIHLQSVFFLQDGQNKPYPLDREYWGFFKEARAFRAGAFPNACTQTP